MSLSNLLRIPREVLERLASVFLTLLILLLHYNNNMFRSVSKRLQQASSVLSQYQKAMTQPKVFNSTAAAAQRVKTDIKTTTPKTAAATPSSSSSSSASPFATMSDEQLVAEVEKGTLKFFNLEKDLNDLERAVRVRRLVVEAKTGRQIPDLPFENYRYDQVAGVCCENVVGYVPIPVGVAGPLTIDGKEFFLPMATTEGALVASTARGCRALNLSGGVNTEIVADGMSRAPVLHCPSIKIANQIKQFTETHLALFQQSFNSTSRFARLQSIQVTITGRKLFLRFKCTTGDAMGMNMVGKGVEQALRIITDKFEDVHVIALSGNVCTDKKPSAINWLDGRGKTVVCEAVIPEKVVREVLKTTPEALIETNYAKNLVGSAVAGSIGGNNAHASNIVTAMFLATGQDPAQNVESSNCMTLIEKASPDSNDVYISVSMPSLEVGTVGGGTALSPQSAMLTLLGVKGSAEKSGDNAKQLARVIASGVMAGELSLLAALSSGHLISSHMKLNRRHGPETTKH